MDIAKNKKRNNNMDLPAFGRVPPQAVDIEKVVLGTVIQIKDAIDVVAEILRPECFYLEAHKMIYDAAMEMYRRNYPVDIVTIIEELRKREQLESLGGPYAISLLTNSIVASTNVETHARIILQKFIQREVIKVCSNMVGIAYEDNTDVFDLLDTLEVSVSEITTSYIKKDYKHISQIITPTIKSIEERRHRDTGLTGVSTGYPEMNKTTLGWQPTDLVIIAARPSIGKTAYALNLAQNAATDIEKPVPVGFFSLEMSESQLVERLLSNKSQIWLQRLKTGKLDDYSASELYKKGAVPLSQAPIYIDDSPALAMFELRTKARKMKKKHGVGLIIIDYLQLMTGDDNNRNGSREQEISKISRELKKLAKNLNLPIIALSQLSRDIEKRGHKDKMPKLSDLRESGAIEQDADIVIFLYRPDDDDVQENPALKDKALVRIAKHRNGILETFAFTTDHDIQSWKENGIHYGNKRYKSVDQANKEQARQLPQPANAKMWNEPNEPVDDLPF